MMKILALVDRYLFSPEATQICARLLLEEFARRGHSVTVVTLSEFDSESVSNGVEVIEIATYRHPPNSSKQADLFRDAKRKLEMFSSWFYGLPRGHLKPIAYLNMRLLSRVKELVLEEKYDLLVSFSSSFATHEVASVVKADRRIDPFWIAYEMDPYALNYTLPHYLRGWRCLREKRVLEHAELIIQTDGIRAENEKHNHLVCYSGKTRTIRLPGFQSSESTRGLESDYDAQHLFAAKAGVLRFVYTGAFYDDIRRPEPLLRLLSGFDFDYQAIFCGNINEAQFDGFPEVRSKSVLLGRVSPDTALACCRNADVLLDVQNDVPNQIPSKLFVYMSTGKPIVSLYSRDCSLGIRYLDDYPSAICIEKSRVSASETKESFESFCLKDRRNATPDELDALSVRYSAEGIVDDLFDAIRDCGLKVY